MAAMDYQKGVVTAAYASALVDYVRACCLDPAALYSPQQLASLQSDGHHGQITISDWIAMFDIAASALNDPNLALKAGTSIKARHLGTTLAQVIMSCANLAEVAQSLARYARLLGEIGQPKLELQGARAHLILHWPYLTEAPIALVQFMQAARVSLTRWLVDRPDLIGDLHFTFPEPSDTACYEKLAGGQVLFGQRENKIVIDTHWLQAPIVSADPVWRERAEQEAHNLLQQLSGTAELQMRVKEALIDKLKTGHASLNSVASHLGINARTLQRKLDAEGYSFRRILDEVRLTRAKDYLQDPQISLADIAFLLGYTEQSAFQHAFKQWMAFTPGEYRAKALQR